MSEPRDPFEALAQPVEARPPRPRFARELRARLAAELGIDDELDLSSIPTVELSGRTPIAATSSAATSASRSSSPSSSSSSSSSSAAAGTEEPSAPGAATVVVTPYLAVRGAADALDWYVDALGATETFRVVGDDGRLGHAELDIGGARLMLSDEYPEIGVHSPTGLEGTSVSLHLEVPDVDALFARAVAAGATSLGDPADQPHGSRHGTLLDPFGHRWMLSQVVEDLDLATYTQRSEGSGFSVQPAATPGRDAPASGEPGIWAGLSYRDAPAGIRFLVDVLGFEEQSLATDPDDPSVVVHSELRWPEGGVVQAGTYVADNEFMQAPGAQAIYVITRNPHAVWERCRAAGVEVVRPPEQPHYHPGGMGFAIRDPEGNILSFGDYAGGA